MTSIHSQCEDCLPEHHHTTTEVYPDIPSENTRDKKDKNPLVWGDDILFLDQRNSINAHQIEDPSGEPSCRTSSIEEENKLTLQHQLQGMDNENNSKIELTVTNMVSLSELSEIGVMESDKFISLPGFSFFPRDEEAEDLNDICTSLQLGSMVEAQPCTIEEMQQQSTGPTPEEPPPSGRMRRTRNASRRLSTISAQMSDDAVFTGHTEGLSSARKRNMSEHSIMSTGSYDDPDSPYHANGRRKRRRYEEDPSDDPAFEKSRKNAIIAKRNREKKKQLMEQMESRCDKLSALNEQLDTDNSKLRHRVQTLEEEVYYLKSVLANQSALSNVLSTLKNVDQVRFSSSFEASKYAKKSAAGMSGNSSTLQRPSNSSSSTQLKVSGGICLHVDGNTVSMEMCAKCAQVSLTICMSFFFLLTLDLSHARWHAERPVQTNR